MRRSTRNMATTAATNAAMPKYPTMLFTAPTLAAKKNPRRETPTAQATEPSAFQSRNERHRMPEAPAKRAAPTRRMVTQRPRKTVLAPWWEK